jgi:hypothetical protein
MQMLLVLVGSVVIYGLMVLAPFVACALLAVVARGSAGFLQPMVEGGVISIVITAMLLAVGTILSGLLVWLAALWYRRSTLLADRKVAEAYGRNVFLGALPKLWVAQRSFGVQWGPMLHGAAWGEEELNLYAQFQDRWDNLPDAYKEKAYREVMVGFRTLLYFDPILEDRMALLAGVPNKVFDDRPAVQLLPKITELGAAITRDLFGL